MKMLRQVQPRMLEAVSLEGIPAFHSLNAVQRRAIAAKLDRRYYQPDDVIIKRGEQSTEVYFLISGRVRACSSSAEGKEVQFEDLDAGEMFGELAALDGRGRSGEVVAIAESTVAAMSQADFLDSLDTHPGLSRYVMTRLTQVIRNQMDRVLEFTAHTVKIRVRSELVRLAERQGEPLGGGVIAITNAPSQSDLAARIGSHREAVNRELKDLNRRGVITWTRTERLINDLETLKMLIDSPDKESSD